MTASQIQEYRLLPPKKLLGDIKQGTRKEAVVVWLIVVIARRN